MGASQPARSDSARAGRVHLLWQRLVGLARTPDVATDLIQILKSVLAATMAWWISAVVMESQLPFLAPWTALLAVQATVYRSVRNGVQAWVASALGVGVSFLIGSLLGVHVWTFALAVFVGVLGARLPWLRTEGLAIATTTIFVLGSGFGAQAPLLLDRLLEVALGVGIGLAVNLLLIPPLRDRQAAWQVDNVNRRMGDILTEMADELENSWDTDRADTWIRATVALDQRLETVGRTIQFARESAHLNFRRAGRRPLTPRRAHPARQEFRREEVSYEQILSRVGEGISHLRNLVRTIGESTYATSEWDAHFRAQWVAILRDAGRSIHDPDAEVDPIQDRLTGLATRMSRRDGLPPGDQWPTYGSLITSLRHIAVIVDDVASARQARDADQHNPQVRRC